MQAGGAKGQGRVKRALVSWPILVLHVEPQAPSSREKLELAWHTPELQSEILGSCCRAQLPPGGR